MKTLVIGASEKPDRYAYKAMGLLKSNGHEVVAIGARKGEAHGIEFDAVQKAFSDVDTVTLYLSPKYQEAYQDYLLITLQPRRVIFNPGTENPEFQSKLEANGIEAEVACTLVLLNTGQY